MWWRAATLVSFVAFLAGLSSSSATSPPSQGDLLASVIADCSDLHCLKKHLLGYLGGPRSVPSRDLDAAILNRVARIAKENEFHVQLPEAVLNADLVFRPGRGLDFDVEFPVENEVQERSMEEGTSISHNLILTYCEIFLELLLIYNQLY
jgi:hypothetical protein